MTTYPFLTFNVCTKNAFAGVQSCFQAKTKRLGRSAATPLDGMRKIMRLTNGIEMLRVLTVLHIVLQAHRHVWDGWDNPHGYGNAQHETIIGRHMNHGMSQQTVTATTNTLDDSTTCSHPNVC